MIVLGDVKLLRVNQAVLDLLAQRKIYHSRQSGERWQVGDTLVVPTALSLEPYTHIFGGNGLPRAMGGFSYSQDPIHPDFMVGRYCSIARNLRPLGEPRPFEWASISPVFFDPKPLQGVRSYLIEERQCKSFPLYDRPAAQRPISIGDDVWIGADVTIKNGVTIGDGAVVGALSLVTKDVPPYTIVGGTPAKVIRMRFSERMIDRFLKLKPFRFGPDDLRPLHIDQPERFLDLPEEHIAAGSIQPWAPMPLTLPELKAASRAASL